MGQLHSCFHRLLRASGSSPPPAVTSETKKEYSWDKKETKDMSRFIIENLKDQREVGRRPGEIDGNFCLLQYG